MEWLWVSPQECVLCIAWNACHGQQPSQARTMTNCRRCTCLWTVCNKKVGENRKLMFCKVSTEPYPGYFPGYYPCRNFCMFCTTFIPVPGASVSYVRHPNPYPKLAYLLYARATIPGVRVYLSHNTRGTGADSGFSSGVPGILRILTSRPSSPFTHIKHENENTPDRFMFLSFLLISETSVLAAPVLQIGIRLFLFGSLVGGTQQYVTCLCMYVQIFLFVSGIWSSVRICSCTHTKIWVSLKLARWSSRV